ncbi:hypothetical protein MTO96_039565 [Rhipicephalus appendiculatus]
MVNGHQISMELDSGSVCSIVNLRTLSKLGISKKALRACSRGVRTYTQQPVWDVGEVEVPVEYNGRESKLPLLVTKGCRISILGRDWFQPLGISLEGLHQLNGAPVSNSSRGEGQPAARDQSKLVTSVKTVLQDYSNVFKPGLGKSTGPPVRIEVEEQATPKFHEPRQVPFALLPKIFTWMDHLFSATSWTVLEVFGISILATLCMHGTIRVAPSGFPGSSLQSPGPFLTRFVSPTVAYGDDMLIRSAASPLDLGGADSDSGGNTADDIDSSVVGQDPPLPGVSEALPSSSPPVSPAPEPDNADVPGSPSQEQSSPNQPPST